MPTGKPPRKQGESIQDWLIRIAETANYIKGAPARAERDFNNMLNKPKPKTRMPEGPYSGAPNPDYSKGGGGGGGGGKTKRVGTPAKINTPKPPPGFKPPMKSGGKTGAPATKKPYSLPKPSGPPAPPKKKPYSLPKPSGPPAPPKKKVNPMARKWK